MFKINAQLEAAGLITNSISAAGNLVKSVQFHGEELTVEWWNSEAERFTAVYRWKNEDHWANVKDDEEGAITFVQIPYKQWEAATKISMALMKAGYHTPEQRAEVLQTAGVPPRVVNEVFGA